MKKEDRFIEVQKKHMNEDVFDEKRKEIHESWFDSDTVDFWRHDRMYATISPIARFYQEKKWLTVGDGRYGLDSYRLAKKFNLNVLPSDISENMLKIGKEKGVVKEYSVENAEALSFEDNSFDVVFCKEAYHHFPRPLIGVYEMIRVASEVVILIEPQDDPAPVAHQVSKKRYILSAMKMLAAKLIGKNVEPYIPEDAYYNVHGNFEHCGNYVYGISNREINKMAHALNLGGMAFYRFNDVYEQGVEFEKAEKGNKLFQKIQQKIKEIDSTKSYNMCATVIFINKIDENLRKEMKEMGYIFPNKTENPYMK